jgi:hypothetical protein
VNTLQYQSLIILDDSIDYWKADGGSLDKLVSSKRFVFWPERQTTIERSQVAYSMSPHCSLDQKYRNVYLEHKHPLEGRRQVDGLRLLLGQYIVEYTRNIVLYRDLHPKLFSSQKVIRKLKREALASKVNLKYTLILVKVGFD